MAPVPGKRTLTESLPIQSTPDLNGPAPVQRDAASGVLDDAGAAADVASRGVASGGDQLPYLREIQASFGRHGVSDVKAHQGHAATGAASVLGARAYAFGDAVAFGTPPDLHTAAHEAAHVIQQRGGLQLKGGIGQPGDAYERHADAVADRVVAGQSAEDLLDDRSAPSRSPAVQRKQSKDDAKILDNQASLNGTDVEIPALEGVLLATRKEAVKQGLLSQASFNAGLALSRAMTQLQPAVAARGAIDKQLQEMAAIAAQQLFSALQTETADNKNFHLVQPQPPTTATISENPYTEEVRVNSWFQQKTGSWLERLPGDIRQGRWHDAFGNYHRMLNGLDLWVADQLRNKGKGTAEEALGNAHQHHAQLRTGLEEIATKHATRLPALFHPDPKTTSNGRAAGPAPDTIPMNVYFWKDDKDGKFHVYDLTTPSRPHEQTVDGPPTAVMMNVFFEEVARYPEGEVRYMLPGGAGGVASTTGKTKWYEWVGYAGLAIAAVGLAFLTAGASIPATVCFAAGAVAGGVSTSGHLVDTARLGTATSATVVLDVAQIVASFASLGAISITVKAGGAAAALARSRWFVPLVNTAAGADVVQLVALTDVTFAELSKIQNGDGSPEDKQRAMAVLFTQFLVMSGLTALSVQGARNARALAGRQLEVIEQNGVKVLRVVGESTSAPVGQSEMLAQGYEKGVAAAGGYQNVPPQVIDALTEMLPHIKVDPHDPGKAIAAWLARELGATEDSVVLKPLGSPGSGALVLSVSVDGRMIGVFKVFPDKGEMLRELAALQRLRAGGLTQMDVGNPSEASIVEGVAGKGGTTQRGGALLEPAKGHFVRDGLIDAGKLPPGPDRAKAIATLDKDVRRVATALAEMHDTFSSGEAVTDQVKDQEIAIVMKRWDRLKGRLPSGSNAALIEKGLKKMKWSFSSAKVDGTVAHGDAHTGNFSVQDSGQVSAIDAETLYRSVNAKGQGQGPAAIDVGRYYESLFTHAHLSGLTASEAEQLQKAFLATYRAVAKHGGGGGLVAAMRLYQVNWQLVIIEQATGKPGGVAKQAVERLATILGVE